MLLIEETFQKYKYHIEDFSTYSSKMIIVKCDFCGDIIEKQISSFNTQRKNSDKDSCNKRDCKNKKSSETKLRKNGVVKGFRKCCKCNEIKPLNDENYHKAGKYGYRYECKECMKKKYDGSKQLVTETSISLKKAIEYYNKHLIDENEQLPYAFFSRIDNFPGFIDYIFKNKTNEYQSKFKNIDMQFIKKYKLYPLINKYHSIYKIINKFYPNYIQPWELKKSPQGYWKNDKNVTKALEWFIEQLFNDKIISNLNQLPEVVTYQTFEKYLLSGMLSHRFNQSTFDAINFIIPNRFRRWDFHLPTGYYKSEYNRKQITTDFTYQLLQDGVINTIEEIPQKVDINTFRKYNLTGFLTHVYQGVSFKAFDEVFPNKWKVWEFNSCPNGFWDNDENIIEAVDWMIEKLFDENRISKISDLTNVLSLRTFQEFNIAKLYIQREKIFEYLSNKYEEIEFDSFHLCIADDGTKCLSKAEVIIHNLFLDNNINAKYCTKAIMFRNEKENERYSPDWIINGNIIIEYFGLYVEHYYNNKILKNYRGKTERKIEYYSSLNDYEFIALYPNDLLKNFNGLKDKFLNYGIEFVA